MIRIKVGRDNSSIINYTGTTTKKPWGLAQDASGRGREVSGSPRQERQLLKSE